MHYNCKSHYPQALWLFNRTANPINPIITRPLCPLNSMANNKLRRYYITRRWWDDMVGCGNGKSRTVTRMYRPIDLFRMDGRHHSATGRGRQSAKKGRIAYETKRIMRYDIYILNVETTRIVSFRLRRRGKWAHGKVIYTAPNATAVA